MNNMIMHTHRNKLIYSFVIFVIGILIMCSRLFFAISDYALYIGGIIAFASIIHSCILRKRLLDLGKGKIASSSLTIFYKFHFPFVVFIALLLNPLLFVTGNYFIDDIGVLVVSELMFMIWLIPAIHQLRFKELKHDDKYLYVYKLTGDPEKISFKDIISIKRRVVMDYVITYKDIQGKIKKIHFMPTNQNGFGTIFGHPKCIKELRSKI